MANDGFFQGVLLGQAMSGRSDTPASSPRPSSGGGNSSVGVAIDARFKALAFRQQIYDLQAELAGRDNLITTLAAALSDYEPDKTTAEFFDKELDEGRELYRAENSPPQYSMLD